ncbi:MAG: glycosyltransferase family 2 protein [Lentisphaerae bacterium]|jgi:GT2 family glycosyltransferase|nr:glycosyltransferase family 2 protein [Lentisphaerota bacterium]
MQPVLTTRLVSVVIPTYRRGDILLDTVQHLLQLTSPPAEIILVDQTEQHSPEIEEQLQSWVTAERIHWLRVSPPSIPRAMNTGALAAQHEVVLFLDDDLVPGIDLIVAHSTAHAEHPDAWAVVGQINQPEGPPENRRRKYRSPLTRDLDFNFSQDAPAWVTNLMAGNCSVKRTRFLELGGFDENFIPPVSYRFETEFAKRLCAAGGRIWYEPSASIRHLRAGSGGTRSRGQHLASVSPLHSVGAYYYMLQQGQGADRLWQFVRRPFREVRTKFHLTHPWWIPVKLIGELRAMLLARRLYRAGPRLIDTAR